MTAPAPGRSALILGASGQFGRAAARAFAAAGWTIRRFDRSRDDLCRAAEGMDVIVNGLNPQGYRNWEEEVPRITAAVIRAGVSSGATLIQPGSVYALGLAPAPWSAATRHCPVSPKGRVRDRTERVLAAAARHGGPRTIHLRAGDFMGPDPQGTWFGELLKGVPKGRLAYPGPEDTPHAWAWVPDLARAAVGLAEIRHTLPDWADIAFPGSTLTGGELRAALSRAAGRSLAPAAFPWWQLRLAAPLSPLAAGALEMRHLWQHPHWLDGSDLARHLPGFAPTPLHAAMAQALAAQGRAMSTQTSRWSEETGRPVPTSR